jgi:hypothetical protein
MVQFFGRVVGVMTALTLASCGDGRTEPAPSTGGMLTFNVVAEPRPVTTSDARTHLVYELVGFNDAGDKACLEQVEVSLPDTDAEPLLFKGDDLRAIMLSADGRHTTCVAAGSAAVLFIDLVLEPTQALPERLEHAVVATESSWGVTAAPVAVLADQAVVVAPPLAGADLLAGNGCCRGAHSQALALIEDEFYLAQRYAIDFVRVEGNSTFSGEVSSNASYFLYGAEVLAVGAGTIVEVRDDVAENRPTEPLPPATIDGAPGNYVLQQLGDGKFVLYAHLQPGSLRVRVGDVTEVGQILGLVGNSGNSTEPHLHFHVMDAPSPFASNGLPYVFDHFALSGRLDLTGIVRTVSPVSPPELHEAELPLDGDLLDFTR